MDPDAPGTDDEDTPGSDSDSPSIAESFLNLLVPTETEWNQSLNMPSQVCYPKEFKSLLLKALDTIGNYSK